MKKSSRLLPIFFAGLVIIQQPTQTVAWTDFSSITNLFSSIPNPIKSACVQIPLAYGAVYAATALHECGHAVATLATNTKLNGIFIGRYPTQTEEQSTKRFDLRIGLSPSCSTIQRDYTSSRFKNALISAAGPATGLLSSYLMLKASNHLENNQLLQLAAYYTAFKNIQDFLPNSDTRNPNDGTNLCNALGVSKKIVAPLQWLGHTFYGKTLLAGALATACMHINS